MTTYAILGPIELSDGGRRVPAGGPRQVALLAFLLVHANRAVPVDRLLDALWRERQDGSSLKPVHMAIARLRKTLDSHGSGAESRLQTAAGGYLLKVRHGDLDADVFANRLQEGRGALDRGEAAQAAEVLRDALALWRGPPLCEVGYEEWAQPEIRRLKELRLAALECRVDADLRLGHHAELIGELEALVAAHPAREGLVGQLMLALYRCGRQAEALDAYQRTRIQLAAELGLEPGPTLRSLQREILEQAPSLQVEKAPVPRRLDARRVVAVLAVRGDVDDPEALHSVFTRCTALIEQHGGTVERYYGDALVGFFGIAQTHGDEPLRAVRAAAELRAAIAHLRIGIELGEVFLSCGPRDETITTGAVITAAGRLAERAAHGDILLGERMRPAVATEPNIDHDGERLLELRSGPPALLRASEKPFVGRARELEALHSAFARARDERTCRLVTVAGPPGIGKSRLAAEFLSAVGDEAMVLAGRCLAYGEGTAYQPLVDIVRGLAGENTQGLEDLVCDEQVVRGIHSAIGLTDEPAQMEETSWALRRLLERLAQERPVVLAIEDIHWAATVLLELLDHVVTLSSGSPILVVCLTRPEFLESRPAWSAPQPNRSLLLLDALPGGHGRELAERLGAKERATRIADRAEGNPLFIEQLVAVGADLDDSELPASIQGVLAARIDRLAAGERRLLQCAAVEGRTFHVGALGTLLPDEERQQIGSRLVGLVRKGLIGTNRGTAAGEDAFRFTHALIRESAYCGIPKLLRGQLHAGVAGWLEQWPAAADETVGFHLERACHLLAEVGVGDEREREWAKRAVSRLTRASRSALARGDPAGASVLLERCTVLARSDEATYWALLPALGAALFEAGRMTEATRVLDEALAQVRDPVLQARAQVEREFVRLETQTSAGTSRAREVADAMLPVLERAGDHDGQSRLWCLRARVAWDVGAVGRADEAWCRAAECARHSGDERQLYDTVMRRASAAVYGPTPVDEAISLCEEIRGLVYGGAVAVTATMHALASLYAMKGEFERARTLLDEANDTRRKLGDIGSSVSHHEALVEMYAGRPECAEERLRDDLTALERIGDGSMLATTTAMLAQAVYAQRRAAEAAQLCRASERAAAIDDIVTQVLWRGVQARIAADEGRWEQGRQLARQALELIRPTDLLTHHGDVLLDLAHVLRASGDVYQPTARRALSVYKAKGNAAAAARATAMLEQPPGENACR